MSSFLPLVITSPLYIKGSTCGYCHAEKSNFVGLEHLPKEAEAPTKCTHITVGSHVEQMTSKQYVEFIERGFRRLGQFLYKGDMLRGCCRMYTIRTNMLYLKVSKEQRQCVNKFKKAIGDGTEKENNTKKLPPFDLQTLIEAEQDSSKFRTRFEPSRFSREKFELYKKYQVHVHNDKPEDVTESQFTSFLCKTPFPDDEIEGTPEQWETLNSWVSKWRRGEKLKAPKRIGPTHECYYLNERLIAISILDFLPNGLSSIYFIWDPDYAQLSLGTLLGIREIQMCQELDLGYYYLGYYIEDCAKMKYKAKFGGEILDVCSEAFLPIKEVSPYMENGMFFTVRPKQQEREEIEEKEVALVDSPDTWKMETVNISKQIYGSPATYISAAESLKSLQAFVDVGKLKIPLVFPGAVTLPTLCEWFSSEVFGLETEVNVYTRSGSLERSEIGDLDQNSQTAIIDTLRLFGPTVLQNSIIIVQ